MDITTLMALITAVAPIYAVFAAGVVALWRRNSKGNPNQHEAFTLILKRIDALECRFERMEGRLDRFMERFIGDNR